MIQERAEHYRGKCRALKGQLAEMEAATSKWQGQADEVGSGCSRGAGNCWCALLDGSFIRPGRHQ